MSIELISVQLNQGDVRLGDAFGESACAPFQDVGKEMRSDCVRQTHGRASCSSEMMC